LSSEPKETNRGDPINYSRYYVKRLMAGQLIVGRSSRHHTRALFGLASLKPSWRAASASAAARSSQSLKTRNHLFNQFTFLP